MDICAKPGTKVRFINANGLREDRDKARFYLTENEVYTVNRIAIGPWRSEVFLEEVLGQGFNTVMFEEVKAEPDAEAQIASKEATNLNEVDGIIFATVDPETLILGRPAPALTTLLYVVCGNDEKKFEQADRLIRLFVEAALKHARGKSR
ncbi:hypothetical protein [Planktothrix phage Pra-JY27]|nr:hypothetical protein [Planktothrix phage Pag-Yong1]WEV89239.1 hypothetical protein [Synechococcus phage MinM2]